ncbi:integrase domain-containing protein [Paraburkholderia sp. GAS334]|uniref:integrase domain-containing protein n=1 Tax=Paraburkholderia sp. GAS334 TaxID=3035131 RepID=UPI003D1B70AC
MGKRQRFEHEVSELSKRAGGSYENQKNRRLLWRLYLRYLQLNDLLPERVKDTPLHTLEPFVQYCLLNLKKPGDIANRLAAIRVCLRHAGVNPATIPTNRDLAVPRRNRSGTRRPYTDEEFHMLLARCQKIDQGLYHIVWLCRLLGLRLKEALECNETLQEWREALRNGEVSLPIRRGAKNKRFRRVEILMARRAETLQAVEAACAFCDANGGELIGSRHNNLKGAVNRLKPWLRRAGMTGELSLHALRYTYACDKANEIRDAGIEELEALVTLSELLGHGPTRARWIFRVYLKSVAHRFPSLQPKARTRSAQASARKARSAEDATPDTCFAA